MIIKDYEVCSPDMCSGGTSLKGYKTTTYDRLVAVLGPQRLLVQTHMTKCHVSGSLMQSIMMQTMLTRLIMTTGNMKQSLSMHGSMGMSL